MSVVKMSNEAYTEFKSFLQENGVETVSYTHLY